ncbi:CFDP2 protein, partial [Polyodon spathula]|nr:CFDP2 protein [Polyodon spathula]
MELYSGHIEENAPHTDGVAVMLPQEAQKALTNASFKTKKKKKIKINVMQCYARTNNNDEGSDLILKGDFNTKTGANNTGYEAVMGILGQMNENGKMFADLCASNRLVMGGSVYPCKRVHKATWISSDHVTENQIDHICIGQKFRWSLQDVGRGADAASDHNLLLAKLKKSWRVESTRIKYNV